MIDWLIVLRCEGFIDFIVDPSFQVMSDVIDKILEPMQQERQKHMQTATGSNKAIASQQGIHNKDDDDDESQ